jgi:hypothetical protein
MSKLHDGAQAHSMTKPGACPPGAPAQSHNFKPAAPIRAHPAAGGKTPGGMKKSGKY